MENTAKETKNINEVLMTWMIHNMITSRKDLKHIK